MQTLRRSAGLSEAELAERAGYKNSAQIVAIENGSSEPSFEKTKDIANALGVSINQLKAIGRVELTDAGWPKLSDAERLSLFIIAPMIKTLGEEDTRIVISIIDALCKRSGKSPKWDKTDYQKKSGEAAKKD